MQYVKPIIGTQRMGHTFPGATMPFGMVQLSPDTDTIPYSNNGKYVPDVYKYCAGYQYDDKTIVGFSHTHFSGTGHSDLGDFLVMPTTGKLLLNPGTASAPASGFRSGFSHNNETAEAGYYKVLLDKYNVTAELTATERVGIHQYTFPAAGQSHLILDLTSGIYNYDGKNVWTFVQILNDSTVVGYRQTSGWARTRTLYFALKFSKPFSSYGSKDFAPQPYRGFWGKFDQQHNFPELAGNQLRLHFDYKTAANEKILIKFALSPVSTEGAMRNLQAEAPGWDFAAYKNAAQMQWEQQLQKIKVQGAEEEKINFYTALYHASINPTIYMDVDGQYKGLDQNIHTAKGFTNYTTFSLWDTYRALHPLFNIIEPQRNADMVRSMLAHYDQSVLHMLPIWSNSANDNWCMSGYHAVSVLADAYVKGNITKEEGVHALAACVATANHRSYEGIGMYKDMGYIPVDKNGVGISTTLEYAYDDWAITQLAKALGDTKTETEFLQRSMNYKNVFDPATGFMAPRLADGTFRKNFDPLKTDGQGFIEGNAWNYSFFVPQYPNSLIDLMGGKKRFVQKMDSLFTMHLPDEFFAETEDITRDGIIGGYVHGNEPAHHIVYLYNDAGAPAKTQSRVRMILKNQYHNGPAGLGGNDDTGQMSAWYIFSSLGFYPVAPGSTVYYIGSPAVIGAEISLPQNKKFSIIVHDQKETNIYVKKVALNGKEIKDWKLRHADIMDGGVLEFWMSKK